MSVLWLWWCWLAGVGIFAPTDTTPVAEADVRFTIENAGLAVEGTLAGLEADIRFDPAHPELASIRASVAVSTIRTGIALRDQHLQKPDYFDAAKFPVISLQATAIRKTGKNRYEGDFQLAIKGTQRQISIPFEVSAGHVFTGRFQLNRLDYGIGKKNLVLGDEVNITIRVKLAKAAALH